MFQYKPADLQMDDCQIEKVVELSREEFGSLKLTSLRDRPFIAENKGCLFSRDDILHCLLALEKDGRDGILIASEGDDLTCRAAYIPGMRDIVNAKMDRAADYIVRQGVENTGSGNWCIYFQELEDHLGLTVREGDGLDDLLLDALYRREEVSDVEMTGDYIDTNYYTDFCHDLDDGAPVSAGAIL